VRVLRALPLAWILTLLGCAAPPERGEVATAEEGAWAGQPIGARPVPQPALRQALLSLADREWVQFGRQKVVYTADEESIPHVGLWEDEDPERISRVNLYWRAVGRPDLSGRHCQAPWSAAFISWLMREAGVPEWQFPPAAAHRSYLTQIIESSGDPGRYFVPRSIEAYRPAAGDLICASAEIPLGSARAGQVTPWSLHHVRSHCDLVVRTDGRTLEAIGGNVRNSVSKSLLELDEAGHLQPVERRAWFLVLENRL
jgi:hypothetical protein